MPGVTVVVPVYRNQSTLAELVRRLHNSLAETAHEILFVNDASPDGSGELLNQLAGHDPSLRVIHLPANGGQSRAVLRGMQQAAGSRLVVMDADLQDPPEAIPSLLATMDRGGWDAVFAGRRGIYQSYARMATSKLFKFAVSRLCGTPRDGGGFYALSRHVAQQAAALNVRDPYLPAMIGHVTGHITSIPVDRDPRTEGASAYTGGARARVAWNGIRTALELRALR